MCESKTVNLRIYNTHGLKRIHFALQVDSMDVSPISLEPEPGGSYVVAASAEGNLLSYTLTAEGEQIENASLSLRWQWNGCSCTMYGCGYPPAKIEISDLWALDSVGLPLPITGISGGVHTWTDYGTWLLSGRVFYVGGLTPAIGAEVVVSAVGDIRLDGTADSGATNSLGEFQVDTIGADLGRFPTTLTIQAWLPGDCGSRTDVEEIVYGGSGSPAYHNFILPIPPPVPDPTPTPTEAPACVESGNVIIYK